MSADTIRISYGELNRLAPEALRMLGISFGHVDGAVEGFVWTEAVLAQGLRLFANASDGIEPRAGGPGCSVKIAGDGSNWTKIDLGGLNLLVGAGRVADFVASDAAHGAPHKVRVVGTSGGVMVPYIAYRLAKLGLSATLHWSDTKASAIVLAEVAAEPIVSWSGMVPWQAKQLREQAGLDDRYAALLADLDDSPREGGATLSIVASRVDARPGHDGICADATFSVLDWQTAVATAMRAGLVVPESDFRQFERFAMNRWVEMKR